MGKNGKKSKNKSTWKFIVNKYGKYIQHSIIKVAFQVLGGKMDYLRNNNGIQDSHVEKDEI